MPADFAHGPHRLARDHAGTGRSGHEHHVGRAIVAFDLVRNRRAFERHRDHAPHAFLAGLLDAGRHFVGLAVAPADFALAVADDDHRGKAEAATALDDRRTTADGDDVLANSP